MSTFFPRNLDVSGNGNDFSRPLESNIWSAHVRQFQRAMFFWALVTYQQRSQTRATVKHQWRSNILRLHNHTHWTCSRGLLLNAHVQFEVNEIHKVKIQYRICSNLWNVLIIETPNFNYLFRSNSWNKEIYNYLIARTGKFYSALFSPTYNVSRLYYIPTSSHGTLRSRESSIHLEWVAESDCRFPHSFLLHEVEISDWIF